MNGLASQRRATGMLVLLVAVSLLVMTVAPASGLAAPAAKPSKPIAKNFIVMISDGWSFNHLTATSYYEYGKDARQIYNRYPFELSMTTFMDYASGDPCKGWGYDPALAWSNFAYVMQCYTDSAAAATAMSTGEKTYDGAIGVGMDGQPLLHVLEMAEQKGKSTGVVTSVEWTHATPASFVAHNVDRDNYVEIGQEMIYDSAVDVIMGAGHPWYDKDGLLLGSPTFKYVGGEATWIELQAGIAGGDANGDGTPDPWVLIESRAEFQSLASGDTPDRVVGVAQVYQTLQQGRSGDGNADPYVVPLIQTVPTLEEMTKAALNILDDDPDGFFLMVEGGAVDWASHANQSGRMIEESIDFERAVEAVDDWVKANSNWGETLLIVTGDHETGYLTGPGSDPTWEPIVNNGAGNLPGMEWHSSNHTNSLMFVSAKGDAGRMLNKYVIGRDPVHGKYMDNTNIADLVFWAMNPK